MVEFFVGGLRVPAFAGRVR